MTFHFPDPGHLLLQFSFWVMGICLFSSFLNLIESNEFRQKIALKSFYIATVSIVLSLLWLGFLFWDLDFRFLYIWQHCSSNMEFLYRIGAIWGGMNGSMLLWAVLTSLMSSFALYQLNRYSTDLCKGSLLFLSLNSLFFISITVWLTNPFTLVPGTVVPIQGRGLNPLLQNPSMMIHPPLLYIGFAGLSIPGAAALGALLSGDLKGNWIPHIRGWSMLSWTFLTAGIVLGGSWAYMELGWGGVWAWDPVENSSLMPWLCSTAFLHSAIAQQRVGMLAGWNIFLAVISWMLTVLGTFLTRSGIVQSVHAFAFSDIGWVFLVYLGIIGTVLIFLLSYRFKFLFSGHQIKSYFSREAFFLFNNLILLGICFATLWGVFYPIISETVTGVREVVGAPYFNRVNGPLFLILLVLMGMGLVLPWYKGELRIILKRISLSLLISLFASLVAAYVGPGLKLASFGVGAATLLCCVAMQEIWKGKGGLLKDRRFGGLLVHFGMGVVAFAIIISWACKTEKDLLLQSGQSDVVAHYKVEMGKIEEIQRTNFSAMRAPLKLYDKKTGEFITEIVSERRIYQPSGKVTTEVGLHVTALWDFYLAFAGIEYGSDSLEDVKSMLKVFINPLQMWLWVGSFIMVLGGGLSTVMKFRES